MAPTNHTPEEMTARLGGQWKGSHGRARCPAHDDRKPSLHISQQGKKILVHCFAGCTQEQVLGALKRMGLWNSVKSTRARTPNEQWNPRLCRCGGQPMTKPL